MTLILLFLMSFGGRTAAPPPVTLAIVNARVWTGDPKHPWAEAVAASGEKIVAVGTSAEIRKLATKTTTVIDARGGLVAPGFIDSHTHFVSSGFSLSSVQLRDARTRAEFIKRIKEYALTVPAQTWIIGGDWDHSLWGGELPTKEWIDSVTPNNPVWINRTDGHMSLANSYALRWARITKDTKDPEGGRIIRDKSGEPTGILKDNALGLVDEVLPEPTPELADRALDAAMNYVASHGVTSVVDMDGWRDVAVAERAHKASRMKTRMFASVPLSTWAQLKDTVAARGRGDAWLRIGGLKGFVDGSAGSHTALMFRPFADSPKDSGLWVTPAESLYAWTSAADKAGLQVMVHAIGDRAIKTQLDIFERVAKEDGPRDRRFRIEHAQHPAQGDIPRFAKLGVIASMQPYHAIDDGRWMDSVIGPQRTRWTYAFRTFIDSKAIVAFGSDWFVAPAEPIYGIYAAVTRRTLDNKNPNGWVPQEKITVEEALKAYTVNAAYAEFAEQEQGSLEVGKLADIVIIDRDLTKIDPNTIRDAKVVATIVGGKIVYDRTQAPPVAPAAAAAFEVWQVQKPAVADPGNKKPEYPAGLLETKKSGYTTVRFVVDTTGKVDMSTVKYVTASDVMFGEAVRAVLPEWKFSPAMMGGKKVRQWVQLPEIRFKAP